MAESWSLIPIFQSREWIPQKVSKVTEPVSCLIKISVLNSLPLEFTHACVAFFFKQKVITNTEFQSKMIEE